MRYLLIAAWIIFAALFGLSAIAAPVGVSADTKYLAPMPTAVQVDAVPALGLSTPSAAQADCKLTVNSPIVAGNAVALIAPQSAASGGGRLGVATAPTHRPYT
ncbi:MAG: hypothetical protein NUV75_02025 [Gallionella sp.]|nr:hypothetical protein [Gallionella sp.]